MSEETKCGVRPAAQSLLLPAAIAFAAVTLPVSAGGGCLHRTYAARLPP